MLNPYKMFYNHPYAVDAEEESVDGDTLFMHCMRKFHQAGGFNCMLERSLARPWQGCQFVQKVLQPLHMAATGLSMPSNLSVTRLAPILPTDIFNEIVEQAVCGQLLHERVAKLEGEELRLESPDNVQHVLSMTERMLLKHKTFYYTSQKIYKFRLAFAVQCLRSPYLDKRLHGLREMCHLTSQATKAGSQGGTPNSQLSDHERKDRHWVDPLNMLAWLKENDVINALLGTYINAELLKRAKPLMEFMLENQSFDQEYLDLMWKTSLGKHGTNKKSQ